LLAVGIGVGAELGVADWIGRCVGAGSAVVTGPGLEVTNRRGDPT
jgi:hypothetical protein